MKNPENNSEKVTRILLTMLVLIFVAVAVVDDSLKDMVLYCALVGGLAAIAVVRHQERK